VTEVDLVRAPDHTPQARPGPRRKVSDCLFQEPARAGPAALTLAAWLGRRTVHAASPRQLFPPVQLTRHSTGLKRPVFYGSDRGNHTRTHPGHVMNSAFMCPANRFLKPDHARGSTSQGPFGQTSPLDYHRHVPDCRRPRRLVQESNALSAMRGSRSRDAAVVLGSRDSATVSLLVNARGLTELIALNVGLASGLIDQRLFTILVLMALATTLMTGPALSLLRRSSVPSAAVEEPHMA
jgi:hypothetical protein